MPLYNPPITAAPTDADYLVGTANGSLSAEIAVGTSPGGELGGTWASPTIDTTHSGSAHTDMLVAALGADATHAAASDPHTGYLKESGGTVTGDLLLDTTAGYDVSSAQFMIGTQTPWADSNIGLYNTKMSYFPGNCYFGYTRFDSNMDYNGDTFYLPLSKILFGTSANNVILWQTDNQCDIGQVAAYRPRTVYAGTSLVAPLIQGLSINLQVQATNITIPANYCAYASGGYEVASGITLELAAGATFEVG